VVENKVDNADNTNIGGNWKISDDIDRRIKEVGIIEGEIRVCNEIVVQVIQRGKISGK